MCQYFSTRVNGGGEYERGRDRTHSGCINLRSCCDDLTLSDPLLLSGGTQTLLQLSTEDNVLDQNGFDLDSPSLGDLLCQPSISSARLSEVQEARGRNRQTENLFNFCSNRLSLGQQVLQRSGTNDTTEGRHGSLGQSSLNG